MHRIAILILCCGTASAGGDKCKPGAHVKERARDVAALDVALQQRGGHVLVPKILDAGQGGSAGTVWTDGQQHHWLVVGEVVECEGLDRDALWVIDGDGNVFVPQLTFQASSTEKVTDCDPQPCGRCGIAPTMRPVAVEVPTTSSKLVKPHRVTVPMDHHVEVKVPTRACLPPP